MSGMEAILENVAIHAWTRVLSRAPGQANAPHESDAELVELPGLPEHYLAITIDTVAEEIRTGLYRDPTTMGWMAVMASLADLAAVGADPLGLVVSASTPPEAGPAFVEGIARGMEQACRSLGVFILGGDSNASPAVSLTGCAVGVVPRGAVLTRRGLEPGDALFLSGRAGAGNALGLVRLAGLPEEFFPEERYRPKARLSVGQTLRGRASACMDTSDGVLATLDQLMRLNGHGFEVGCDCSTILGDDVLALCERARAPQWMMLAGPHGEFELAFTVRASRAGAFVEEARAWETRPIRIGTVQERPAITFTLPSGRRVDIDMAPLRNLLETTGGDFKRYLKEFRELGSVWGLD